MMRFREKTGYWVTLMLLSVVFIAVDYLQTNYYLGFDGISEMNPLTRWWINSGFDLLSFFGIKILLFGMMVGGFYMVNKHRLPLVLELMFLVNMAVIASNFIMVWLAVV